jgi:hypothetical protein
MKDIDGKTDFSDGDLEEIVRALERDINKVYLFQKGHLMLKTCK